MMFDDGSRLEFQADATSISTINNNIDIGLSGNIKFIYTQGGVSDSSVSIDSLDGLL